MPKTNKEYVAERFNKNKPRALKILGGKCVKCGVQSNLQFDHIKDDRDNHCHQISVMLRNNSWGKIEEELKKCQLLCQSCHQKKSLSARGYNIYFEHGTVSMYKKRGCRCSSCRRAVADYAIKYRQSLNFEQNAIRLAKRREYRRKHIEKVLY